MNKFSYQKYIMITTFLSLFVVILISFSFRDVGDARDVDRDDVGDRDLREEERDRDNNNIINGGIIDDETENIPPNRPDSNNRPIIVRPPRPARPSRPGNNNNNNNNNNGNNNNNLTPGTISMSFTEAENGIRMINAMPMSDAVGMVLSNSNEIFDFTVNSNVTGNSRLEYEVAIIKDPSSTLSDDEVRLYLTRVVGTREVMVSGPMTFTPIPSSSPVGASAGSMIMQRITISESANTRYRLRMWVAEGTPITDISRTFSVTVNVYGRSVN